MRSALRLGLRPHAIDRLVGIEAESDGHRPHEAAREAVAVAVEVAGVETFQGPAWDAGRRLDLIEADPAEPALEGQVGSDGRRLAATPGLAAAAF